MSVISSCSELATLGHGQFAELTRWVGGKKKIEREALEAKCMMNICVSFIHEKY